ncbi:MAG TPA: hypothetical protein DCS87_03550 [Rheinheimera sp.]|nr:hypothetical protein [Rheinheimera sp.]
MRFQRCQALLFGVSMLVSWAGLAGGVVAGVLGQAAYANTPAEIPKALQDWQGWVLAKDSAYSCYWQGEFNNHQCQLVGDLQVNATAQGASFSQLVKLGRDDVVTLPGDKELWPQQVQVRDVASGAVVPATVADDGGPKLHLPAGFYQIQARFVWKSMPRVLPFDQLEPPPGLQLTIDGQSVPAPRWDDASLVLSANGVGDQTDGIRLDVSRLLQDGVPQTLTTQIDLQVSGKPREYLLPVRLPEGFVLSGISGNMPYKLLQDGSLKLSISVDSSDLTLTAVRSSEALQFTLPPSQGDWPDEEVWALQQSDLRQVLGAAPAVDPSMTTAPHAWTDFPLFRLSKQQALTLSVLSTGMQLRDELSLQRHAWLQPERDRWLVQDQLSGKRLSQMQLPLLPPLLPGRVELDGQGVLIGTTAQPDVNAVELRDSDVKLRLIGTQAADAPLSLHNFDTPLQQVQTTVHLPAGWRALAVTGAESSNGDWLSSWQLWDIFIVLLICAASWRLVGAPATALLAGWFVLSYQQSAPVGPWLHALLALGVMSLLRKNQTNTASSAMRWQVWSTRYYGFALLVLAASMLPYITHSLRASVYPQLPAYDLSAPDFSGVLSSREDYREPVAVGMPAPTAVAERYQAEMMSSASDASSKQKMERIEVTGTRLRHVDLVEVNPDLSAQLLTGPAVPQWRGRTVNMAWHGELVAQQPWQLYLIPSWATRLGDLLSGVLGLVLLLWLTSPLHQSLQRWFKPLASLAIVLLLLPTAPSVQAQEQTAPNAASSQAYPSAELLAELQKRLTPEPACAPNCTSIERLQVLSRQGQPELNLLVHASGKQLFKLPTPANQAQQVLVDNKPALLVRSGDSLWLALETGVHQVQIWLQQPVEQFQLSFDQYWHLLDNQQADWQLQLPSNVQDNRGPYALLLQRVAKNETATTKAEQEASVSELLQVQRSFYLSLRSSITTKVTRLTTSDKAVQLEYPLLPGERPANSWPVRDGKLVIQLNPGETEVQFESDWQPKTPLTLQAAPITGSNNYLEVWQVLPAADWHVDVKQAGTELPLERRDIARDEPLYASYLPWPGQQLTFELSRLTALKGDTLTVSHGSLRGEVSGQASTWNLELSLLTSQAQTMPLQLPKDASLQQVTINGQVLALKLMADTVNLPLANGNNTVALSFRQNDGVTTRYSMPQITAPVPLNNLSLSMQLPDDRWLLALGGDATLVTVLLFWGGVLLSLILAFAATRLGLTPLTLRDSLLLFIGFATMSVWVPVLWVAALAIAGAAGRATAPSVGGLAKLLQASRLVFIAGALIGLCSSVPMALLSAPDMHLVNTADDWQMGLRWFADGVTQSPAVWAFSLPQWSYKLVMLLWALWLASAILRWLPWCWQQLTVQGFWPQSAPKVLTPSVAAVASKDAANKADNTPV